MCPGDHRKQQVDRQPAGEEDRQRIAILRQHLARPGSTGGRGVVGRRILRIGLTATAPQRLLRGHQEIVDSEVRMLPESAAGLLSHALLRPDGSSFPRTIEPQPCAPPGRRGRRRRGDRGIAPETEPRPSTGRFPGSSSSRSRISPSGSVVRSRSASDSAVIVRILACDSPTPVRSPPRTSSWEGKRYHSKPSCSTRCPNRCTNRPRMAQAASSETCWAVTDVASISNGSANSGGRKPGARAAIFGMGLEKPARSSPCPTCGRARPGRRRWECRTRSARRPRSARAAPSSLPGAGRRRASGWRDHPNARNRNVERSKS